MTLWHALRRFLKGDGIVYSGYLAFLSLLILLPVLGVLFWLSQQSAIIRAADAALRDFLFTNLFPDTARQVVAVVDQLRANARGLGMAGVAIIVADALLKALALDAAIDRIWGSPKRSVFAALRGVVVLLLLVPMVVGTLFLSLRFLNAFFGYLIPAWRDGVHTVFEPLEIALPLITALALLYRWGPTHHPSWKSPVASATLITVLIELARYLITHYFAQLQQVKSLYGAFIAFPVILLTLFAVWGLVLYGAALVAEGFGSQLHWPGGRAKVKSRAR